MSIEKILEENTEALKALTAAIAAFSSQQSAPTKTEAPAKAKEEKDADAEQEEAPAKKAPAKKAPAKKAPAKKAPAKAKGPTEDDFREQIGAFIGVEDEEERADRTKFVKTLFKEFGVSKASELAGVPEGNDLLEAIKAEKDSREAGADEQEDDDLV